MSGHASFIITMFGKISGNVSSVEIDIEDNYIAGYRAISREDNHYTV